MTIPKVLDQVLQGEWTPHEEWECRNCGGFFRPTLASLFIHTYCTVRYKCTICHKYFPYAEMITHLHKGTITSFIIVRARLNYFKTGGGVIVKANSFAEKMRKDVEQQRKEKFGDTWKPEEGENIITVDKDGDFREMDGQFGPGVVIPLKKPKADWLVNKKSPVVREVAKLIANKQYTMNIIRAGEKKSTRYSVKAVTKSTKKD